MKTPRLKEKKKKEIEQTRKEKEESLDIYHTGKTTMKKA